ncbi:MAG: rod-binding protein [Lachnospiraceae bacterium]|nr:rod-binding protein [Lachnospiraceae bacterium]MBQ9136095.1 rod-binding protein [Lachnospiraceae bacterium]
MDINGLSAYTDLYQTQASQSTSKLENELKSDYAQATNDELMDACKEFEAYFVEQMFKEMMKTVPESDTTSSYTSNLMDYYKDSMVQEIASDSTEQNSLGLAQMLYEQMKRNYGL